MGRTGLHRARLTLRILVLPIVVGACFLVMSGSASAAKLTVCASGCDYAAISDALAAASTGDKIVIGPGTYDGGFVVSTSVSLIGLGASTTMINGGGTVVTVANGVSVTISGVTIAGGSPSSTPETPGGGVVNEGALTLIDTIVTGNVADAGGGIYNAGTLTTKRAVVSHNSVDGSYEAGGGLLNTGSASLVDSIVSHNDAFRGGGITNRGSLDVLRGQVSTNSANVGGGILNEGGAITIRGGKITDNEAFWDAGRGGGGGGIANPDGNVLVRTTLIADNNAYDGGGIFNGDTFTLMTSSVSGNTGNVGGGPGGSGGGILNSGSLSLLHAARVTENTLLPGGIGDGGGLFNTGDVTLKASAIADNTPNDCIGC
jgi:hypothetical protein